MLFLKLVLTTVYHHCCYIAYSVFKSVVMLPNRSDNNTYYV